MYSTLLVRNSECLEHSKDVLVYFVQLCVCWHMMHVYFWLKCACMLDHM